MVRPDSSNPANRGAAGGLCPCGGTHPDTYQGPSSLAYGRGQTYYSSSGRNANSRTEAHNAGGNSHNCCSSYAGCQTAGGRYTGRRNACCCDARSN